MKQRLIILTSLIILASIFIYLSCCEDCPVCPELPPEVLSDYDFYIANWAQDYTGVSVYNTKEMDIIGFYDIPGDKEDIAISADGTELIITTDISFQPDTLVVYGLPDLDTVAVLPVEGQLEVSNTGAYVAVMDDTLVFLDGNTYQILFTDTGRVTTGRFLLDDTKFYTIYDQNKVRIYDMVGESLYSEIEIRDGDSLTGVSLLQPSADGDKIYFRAVYYGSMFYRRLISYYPEKDSIGIRYAVGPGLGHLRITPDGRQIIATDPCEGHGYCGSGDITFIDPEKDRLISLIPGFYSIPGQPYAHFESCIFDITPDSKYALFGSGPITPVEIIALVDLELHHFVDIKVIPFDSLVATGIWCQKFKN
jgi:hypothetical protein